MTRHEGMDFIKLPVIPPGSRAWGNFTLWLVTKEELEKLPDGTILIDIFGMPAVKGKDPIDTETRGGVTPYGFLKELD